ncbi:MAG TPA: sigma-70 family RNA polymerase sigma factor [Candidatus Baltobacteraceae bacterium]|nr:sigma-70 family RNA polymerase sigma factor [Candidatus Baltobacteraceae bacterium]
MDEDLQSSSPCSVPTDRGTLEPLEVEALTRRMAHGDDTAWRSFYDQYFDRLWRYLLVTTEGSEDLARESLQAALVRVARHIKVFRDGDIFWSWLTVLARTALADERKKTRRYFFFLERFKRHAEVERDDANDDRADERLNILLRRHVASLPPNEQKLIEQKYIGRRTVREIAGELRVTEKAVESQLSRIRRKLKDATLKELNRETRE